MAGIIETREGVRFKLLNENDRIGRFLRNEGAYEPLLQKVSQKILNKLERKAGVVIDAGANMGTFCIPLAKHNPTLQVIAFEVQSKIFSQLEENIALNGLRNIRAHGVGLSDRAETIMASIPDYEIEANIGAFSLDEEVRKNDYEVATQQGMEKFPLITLDSFAIPDVLLLKIDVEGMEAKVIQGARDTLARSSYPPVIFETWTWKPLFQHRREELCKSLADIGYRITRVGENNIAQHTSRSDAVDFIVRDN